MVELLLALLTMLTGIDRTVDADLSASAQRRAVEIQADFSHSGWVYGQDGEAEIIAANYDADPVTRLALQWQGSPPHWAILTDPRFTSWGCAIAQAGGATYGVCLFATSLAAVSTPLVVPASAPIVLPNTAIGGTMTADNVRAIIAPITAAGMIFGGGAFLFLTLGVEGARVESAHLIISGLMGGAAQFLFGDAVQRRTNEAQPTVTTTAGPPATTTVTPPGTPSEGIG